jgi:NADH:ubiquinone oxidoreductase subunit 6 (subunit J)
MYYSFSELVQPLLFYLFAFVTLASALLVVLMRNIFHCALFLILSLFGVAALFITLDAEFVAAVQVLVYIGAIAVLIVFAIMLTGKIADPSVRQTTRAYILGAFVGALILFVLLYALMSIAPLSPYTPETNTTSSPTYTLGELLMTKYLLPFEVVSILLVAALVGAIVLARREKKTGDAKEGK